MQNHDYPLCFCCPYCRKGKIFATNQANIHVYANCPVCHKKYVIDLQKLKVLTPKEAASMGIIGPMPYKISCVNEECHTEIRVDRLANTKISIRCADEKCRTTQTINLKTLTAEGTDPIPKPQRRKRTKYIM